MTQLQERSFTFNTRLDTYVTMLKWGVYGIYFGAIQCQLLKMKYIRNMAPTIQRLNLQFSP